MILKFFPVGYIENQVLDIFQKNEKQIYTVKFKIIKFDILSFHNIFKNFFLSIV